MFAAVFSITSLGLAMGLFLGAASRRLKVEGNPMVDEIQALLPGTQCGQCGFPGCAGAAQALAAGQAPVTLCPPGGKSLALVLADKLGVTADISNMVEKAPMIAYVKEELCIGCTRCFKRCPTDAILGGPKQIHAVIGDACIGCEKCVEACPTECVEMRPVPVTLKNWHWPKPAVAV